jgi:hypothetical protein
MVKEDDIVPEVLLEAYQRSLAPEPVNGLFVYVYVESESTQTVADGPAVTDRGEPD